VGIKVQWETFIPMIGFFSYRPRYVNRRGYDIALTPGLHRFRLSFSFEIWTMGWSSAFSTLLYPILT
jgi:hypothetical protein